MRMMKTKTNTMIKTITLAIMMMMMMMIMMMDDDVDDDDDDKLILLAFLIYLSSTKCKTAQTTIEITINQYITHNSPKL